MLISVQLATISNSIILEGMWGGVIVALTLQHQLMYHALFYKYVRVPTGV